MTDLSQGKEVTCLDQRNAVERQASEKVCLIQPSLNKKVARQNTEHSSEEGAKYNRKQVTSNTS